MDPFLGEIRAVGFNFAPVGWALCQGQLLSIQQNSALFSLLGTFYGGNGTSNFALPDLRGRVAMHTGITTVLGEEAGEESLTLSVNEIPGHSHTIGIADIDASQTDPTTGVFAKPNVNSRLASAYLSGVPDLIMGNILSSTGGSQPHNNLQPYLTINYIIALTGVYPSRN